MAVEYFKDPQWPLYLAHAVKESLPDQQPAEASPVGDDVDAKANHAPNKAATAKKSDGIVLDQNWMPRMNGASVPMRELYALLSHHGKAGEDKGSHPDIEIYGGVHYLDSLESAQKKLGIATKWSARNAIAASGFPQTLFWVTYDGKFEGHFNQLQLIVDRSNQVVSVQLVDEHFHGAHIRHQGWHTYNFVNSRVNGSSRQSVSASATPYHEGGVIIDAELNGGSGQNTRWYVPKPLVSLILHCIEKANAR